MSDDDLIPVMRARIERITRYFEIPSPDDEDIAQDVLLTFPQKRSFIRTPITWAAGTAKNKCIMYWRKRRGKIIEGRDLAILELLAGGKDPEQVALESRLDLESILQRLSTKERKLIELRDLQRFSPPKVAELLGYQLNSIRKVLFRARVKFFALLLTEKVIDIETLISSLPKGMIKAIIELKNLPKKTTKEELVPREDITLVLGRADLPEDIQAILGSLNKKQRECLLLIFWLNNSIKEVTVLLQCGDSLIYYARDKFLTAAMGLPAKSEELQEIIAKMLATKRSRRKRSK